MLATTTMETNKCLKCNQPTARPKFCSDKCKSAYFNERKQNKEEYDPLLALWAAVVLPENVDENIKTAWHIHNENIKKLSELGKIMFKQVQHKAEEMGNVQFVHNFLTQVSITFSSITFCSAGL